MSYCLNPNCQKASSSSTQTQFCQNCGSKLLLKERYRAIKLIGTGGFGRTFLAVDEHKPSKPRCAIKQFYPEAQGTNNPQKAAELFAQEAVRLDDLSKHPQIPELLAYVTQDEQQYLVQEFIDGQNLADALAAEGTFNEAQIRSLLSSLLPVLDFIHSHNIIHRDIKPENIIRRQDGQLVLVDFGAAKFVTGTALARTGTVIGSAGYVAPEQALGKAVFASDLYNLGVTCIHLLTQIEPFLLFDPGESAWVWRQYLVNNFVSDQLSCVLDKLIENATNRRYQKASEVLKALNPHSPKVTPNSTAKSQSYSTPTAPDSLSTPQPQIHNWQCIHTLTKNSGSLPTNGISFSPDGQTLADNNLTTINLWQPSSGQLIRSLSWYSNATSIAFSPDGQILATGSRDNTINLWQVGSRQLIRPLTGQTANLITRNFAKYFSCCITSVAFSPDGQTLASGSMDKTVKIWKTSSGKLVHTLTEHLSWVTSVAFSPDGQTLASGSMDKTVKIWKTSSGKLVHTLIGHSSLVNSVAFSPDGQTLYQFNVRLHRTMPPK